MKLRNAFSILSDLRVAIGIALWPTIKAVFGNPTLLWKPHKLSHTFMAHLWGVFGADVDANSKEVKDGLITPYAYGVVLEIGAGHGLNVHYLNRARVTRYIAIEPNTLMHPHIRKNANNAGFHESDQTLLILQCGAEDIPTILKALDKLLNDPCSARSPSRTSTFSSRTTSPTPPHFQVDTIISILTICTLPDIPHPKESMTSLVRQVLKSGGQLLFYEHVLSPREDVVWWQKFWAPIWAKVLDGCRMDRASNVWLEEMETEDEPNVSHAAGDEKSQRSIWREGNVWTKQGEDEESLFWHSIGRYVKK